MQHQLLSVFLLSILVAIEAGYFDGLHVEGNQLKNQYGQTVRLRGVDRSGMEFMCIQGGGFADGPMDLASIQAIQSWGANAIRLPLNEDCWLGINLPNPAYGGKAYQEFVMNYTQLVIDQGMAIILDLHWTAPGTQPATGQMPMPDMDHSLDFWTSVASTFKQYPQVIFDLFNEPYPDNGNWNSQAGWQCWQRGGSCESYGAAGFTQLLSAVRSTGSSNIVMMGGLAWSNSLAQWLQYRPNDPTGQTAASIHIYNFNYCSNTACWDQYITPVAEQVPIIAGEIGQNQCGGSFLPEVLDWLEGHNCSYLAWTWNTWDCNSGPALITDYNGTPTASGAQYKSFLQSHPLD